MSSVTKQDIPEISEFMSDFWKLVKKFYIPEKDDKYWEDLIHEAAKLGHKYKEDRFVVYQINAYLDYLEEKLNGKRGGRIKT